MIKNKITALLLCAAVLCSASAGVCTAAEQTEVFALRMDTDQMQITISGRLPNDESAQRVAVQVKNEAEELVYYSQFDAPHHGEYSFSFNFDEEAGDYTLFLKSDLTPAAVPFQHTFRVVSRSGIEAALAEINAAASGAAFAEKVIAYQAALGLSSELLDRVFTSEYAQIAAEDAFSEKSALPNGQFTVAALKAALDESCMVQLFNLAEDGGEAARITDTYGAALGLDTMAVYPWFEAQKSAVCENLANEPTVFRKNSYKRVFAENIFKAALRAATGGQVLELMSDFAGYMTLTPIPPALSYAEQTAVKNALAGQSYGFPRAEEDYNNAAASANKKNGGNNGGNGGGGGKSPSAYISGDKPTPAEPLVKPPLFRDLSEAEWAAADVTKLAEAGIIDGYEDRTFRPNQPILREEYLKLIIIAFDMQDSGAVSTFTDVSADDWMYPYIAAAQKYAVARGINEREFGVGQTITREDLCVMSYRIAARSGVALNAEPSDDTFTDDEIISDYAREIVYALKSLGIVNGTDGAKFDPKGGATRAEASAVLSRLIARKNGGNAQ